ncbi:hypothetical protein GXM_06331 [Nostoc sphaeroides CCNUC1]|uniref:Uncharacterized protein n=1 Tax=Nostoc sphaeroides CCNUC1 TaxID=2653204 RepID=A0A5P8W7T4_9NOSO|nr:hypothetical protein GXM_06331 [Nostoc sphaeroides CCNUC1]
MFYLLLVIGHGLAASYLLPITHKKGAGGEINSKFKIQNSKFRISASSFPIPCLVNAQFKNCLFSKTVF